MHNAPSTSSALEFPKNGTELADTLYSQKLVEAKNIGDVRKNIDQLMKQVGGNGEAGARIQEIKASVDQATQNGGHGNIKLEDDLGTGVLGENKVGTNDSFMRKDQMDPKKITANARHTLDTVLHENSEDLGHAGQNPAAIPNIQVIDKKGKRHQAVTVLEGNVVSNVSKEIGERREGLPQEVYLEGADLVEEIGSDKVDAHIRGNKVGEHLQAAVWESQSNVTLERMFQEGAAVGMSEDQIIETAKEHGKIPVGATPTVTA